MRYDGGGLDDCVWCGGLLGEGIGSFGVCYRGWLGFERMICLSGMECGRGMESRSLLMIGL